MEVFCPEEEKALGELMNALRMVVRTIVQYNEGQQRVLEEEMRKNYHEEHKVEKSRNMHL